MVCWGLTSRTMPASGACNTAPKALGAGSPINDLLSSFSRVPGFFPPGTQPAGTATAQSPAVAAPGNHRIPVPTNVTAPAAVEHVLLETTMGNITIALDPDMPITAGNFENLTKAGFMTASSSTA